MIKMITDIRPGECDFLSAVKHQTLRILDDESYLLKTIFAPISGWTHELLELVADEIKTLTDSVDTSDAYLGSCWVGGTEV